VIMQEMTKLQSS